MIVVHACVLTDIKQKQHKISLESKWINIGAEYCPYRNDLRSDHSHKEAEGREVLVVRLGILEVNIVHSKLVAKYR